jgi:hypothetical protein
MEEFNFQHNKPRTADAREADEHIILNKLSEKRHVIYVANIIGRHFCCFAQ